MKRQGTPQTSGDGFAVTGADRGPGPDRLKANDVWLAVRLPPDSRLEAALRAMARDDGSGDGADVTVLALEGKRPAGRRVFREIGRTGAPPPATLPPQETGEPISRPGRKVLRSLRLRRRPKLGRTVDVSV